MASNEFLQEMSATFRNMRHSDEMVDVVLVFEKTRVKCHRLVLAASCEYFRRMFQTDMQERDAGEIPMKDVSSTTGLLLVEYLYSGNIEISVENAQELMAVSDRLLLTKLKKNVEEFLCEQVAADNCLSFNNLARLYSLKSLLEVCQNYLSDHWRKLLESDEIDQLTEADLVAVLRPYGSAEASFLLLQKWIKSSGGRTHRFIDLLQYVQLHLFSKEFMFKTVMCEELMVSKEGMTAIRVALESLDREDQSLVVGDFEGNVWFSADKQHWEPIQMLPSEVTFYGACPSLDGFIISGGYDGFEAQCECHAYVAHTKQWRALPSISVRRYFHASICSQDEFMVFGGKMDVESFLDSVECLNLKSLKWSQFPPLPLALSETKPVYVQNKLFIVGGWLSQKTYSRDVYEFDSAKRAWRSRSAMPEECRAGGVVSFDDKLFVVGGDPKSCMHYDPRTDLWVQLQRPLFEHFYGPAAVWNDQIVVCGGAGTDSIEEYDPQSVKWSTWDLKMPSMNDYCFALII